MTSVKQSPICLLHSLKKLGRTWEYESCFVLSVSLQVLHQCMIRGGGRTTSDAYLFQILQGSKFPLDIAHAMHMHGLREFEFKDAILYLFQK